MRLVDEQDHRCRRGLHLVDHRAQALLKLALHRGASLHQADIERADAHTPERRRHVARSDALGEAFRDRGLADAGLAGEDRIVLAPPHQHVDDLPDLVVAAEDRVHRAGASLDGEVLREAVERGRALRPFGLFGAGRACRAQARSVHRPQVFFFRAFPDLAVACGQFLDRNLGEFLGQTGEHAAQFGRFQRGNQQMAGPDLRLPEEQGRVVPATVEDIDNVVGDARHLRLVAAEALDHAAELHQHLGPVELIVIGGQGQVVRGTLQDLEQPMRQLDIAIPRPLRLPERLQEGVVADPVELACDGFEADIGHGRPLQCPVAAVRLRFRRRLSAGWKRASRRSAPSSTFQFGAIQLVQPRWPD